jgi:glycosyltransferase involved in cell wall biosynthesis
MADWLAIAYAKAGHDVLVVTAAYRDAPAREERDGLTIVRLPAFRMPETKLALNFDMAFASRPSLMRNLSRILDSFAPEVLHQHGQFFDLTWASGEYARRRSIPALLTVHTRLENPDRIYGAILALLDKLVVRTALRRYRPPLVVTDEFMQAYITKRYRGLYPALYPINITLDLSDVGGGDPQRIRSKLGLAPDIPLIASVGHVIPVRDRVALVEALPRVLQASPRAKLVVVGGLYHRAFLDRAQELGVADSVITVGAVAKAEVADYLAAATVECHEKGIGIGIATLEAMASGVPVVAFAHRDNFPNAPITDRHHMYLADPGDVQGLAAGLCEALTNPEQARAVGQAGKQWVESNFSLERIAAQYLDALEATVSMPRPPTHRPNRGHR